MYLANLASQATAFNRMRMYSIFESTYVTLAMLSLAYSNATRWELMQITSENLTSTALLPTLYNLATRHTNFNEKLSQVWLQS
jgi:hypothetical protein